MKKVCALIGKYFGVIAVIFLIIGMTLPTSFSWVLGKVGGISVLSVLLGVIMFGMGMTMSVHDFALVLKRPKDVFFGACAQYFVMPFLAYVLSTLFHLDPALTVGVVLVGTCPGGTSSNVITFMSKGDVPLSVTMTSVSTLISPIMTPLLTYLIIGQRISFDPVGMFLSILQIVIVPIALGLIVKSFLPKLADTATDYLPAVSALAISFLIAGIIGASRDAILNSSGIILAGRHPAQLPGLCPGILYRPSLRHELEENGRLVHRSRHAEFRLSNGPGQSTLCIPAHGRRTRCRLQCMAQHLRCRLGLSLRQLPEQTLRLQLRSRPESRCQRIAHSSPLNSIPSTNN